jgi:hypothetical protein
MIEQHLQKIADNINNNSCVFFIGAGISSDCGLPSGNDLSKKFAEQLGLDFENQRLSELAEYFEVEFGRQELIEFLKKELLIHIPQENRGCYNIIVKIPINIIITTNYDNLLQDLSNKYNVIKKNDDLWKINESIDNIIKIHGDLDFPEDIIITDSDFINYYDRYPNISSFLEYIFSTKSIIFLGFGLKDLNTTNILFWANKTMGTGKKKNYAVFKNINKYFKKVLENRNIIVIETNANDFLKQITDKMDIDLDKKEPLLEFKTYYSNEHIKMGDETNINFDFTNNADQSIICISYQFEAYHEGNFILKYTKHAYNERIEPGSNVRKPWGVVNPLHAYFGGLLLKGLYESKVYIDYLIGDDKNIKTVVGSAKLIVE